MKDALLTFIVITGIALPIGQCRRDAQMPPDTSVDTTLTRQAGELILPPQPFTYNAQPGTLYYVFVPAEE